MVSRRVEEWPDGDWIVCAVSATSAGKEYRCPGCDQRIPAGVPHLVTWPYDGPGDGLDQRRHWHRPCWVARDRRQPKTLRARNAPRYG